MSGLGNSRDKTSQHSELKRIASASIGVTPRLKRTVVAMVESSKAGRVCVCFFQKVQVGLASSAFREPPGSARGAAVTSAAAPDDSAPLFSPFAQRREAGSAEEEEAQIL